MQVYTLLQTDNHASTPPLVFYRPDALPAAQPTASEHWRQIVTLLESVVVVVGSFSNLQQLSLDELSLPDDQISRLITLTNRLLQTAVNQRHVTRQFARLHHPTNFHCTSKSVFSRESSVLHATTGWCWKLNLCLSIYSVSQNYPLRIPKKPL